MYLHQRNSRYTIPHRKHEHYKGAFNKQIYRKRNIVERLINRLKQFATRCENVPPISLPSLLWLRFSSFLILHTASNKIITAILLALLLSGAWAFNLALSTSSVDPPITEFYLLGQSGLAQDYPVTAFAGEQLSVTFGIANYEAERTYYQVYASINSQSVGRSQPSRLDFGKVQVNQIELLIPNQAAGQTKVDFILYRNGEECRFLHLWIEVEKPIMNLTPAKIFHLR